MSVAADARRDILKREAEIVAIAKRYYKKRNFLFLGRGINYPIALEGALKLKEISYIHAEGYAAGEMKHGPIALIDKDMPVVVLAPRDRLYEKTVSNLMEVKARNAPVIAFVSEGERDLGKAADAVFTIPDVPHLLTPILFLVPYNYWPITSPFSGDRCRSTQKSGKKRDRRIKTDSMRDGDEVKQIDLIAGAEAQFHENCPNY